MNKLPSEVVFDITSHLPIADKLNLACASKQFYKPISENTLYNKLVIKDRLKFYEAMELHSKKNYGHQVHHICFEKMYHDERLVTPLPTVFPRVRFLKFNGGYNTDCNEINTENIQCTDWNSVESIEDDSDDMNVTLRLLELLTFDNLTSLQLTLLDHDSRTTDERRKRTQTLIESINNAPSLEKLLFGNPASQDCRC